MSHPSLIITYETTDDHFNPNQEIELPFNGTVKEAFAKCVEIATSGRRTFVSLCNDPDGSVGMWCVSFKDGTGEYHITDPYGQFPIDAGLSMTKW